MNTEKFADETHVGAAGELDLFDAVVRVELGGKGFGESLRTGPPRVNERAVNIKQNQSHHPVKLPESGVFREIFPDGTELQVLGALASRRRIERSIARTGRRDAGAPRKESTTVTGASFRIARFAAGAIMPAIS